MRWDAYWTSGALIEPRQTIVDEDPIGGGKDISSLLFDLERPGLVLPYFKLMGLFQRLREPPSIFHDLGSVGPDGECSQKLIELNFDCVLFFATCRYTEFHMFLFWIGCRKNP